MRIAVEGGATVHPVLQDLADSVWAPAWSIVERHPDLVPLWTSGATTLLAALDGTVQRWSAEYTGEPLSSYPDFATAVRVLLADLWELDSEDDDRRTVAGLRCHPSRSRQPSFRQSAEHPRDQREAAEEATKGPWL
ncbi:hypothetical protein [Prescottella agglutinans]|uniref:hypothetical protein n=1 Tax=Prescottella agglutinans TaxID=1644129 RepID=UPI00247620BF|nr:hypothetical protein [Prescottella agglutinans]